MTQVPPSSNKNILADYDSGLLFNSSEFNNIETPIIKLILFSDAVNLCSPVGAAHNTHKIEGVYYAIANIPHHLRYKMDNIQLAFVYNVKLLKSFSLEKIYSFLINDLKELQTTGIKTSFQDNVIVRLIGCSGDNLGLHQLGGFSQCFSSGFICRWCFCTYNDLKNWDYSVKKIRNPENYAESLRKNDHGVQKNSPFNQLEPFHVCNPGLAPDFGHDCFHGAFNVDLVLILNYFLVKNNFVMHELLIEIRYYAKKIKITSLPNISKEKINGRMTDLWNLIVILPLVFFKLKFNTSLDVHKFFIRLYTIGRCNNVFFRRRACR